MFKKSLTAADAVAQLAAGTITVLDVREMDELRASGTALGGIHVPLALLPLRADPKSPDFDRRLAGKPIAVFCAVGGRAGRAADYLASLGYEASNIGGFDAWVAAGGAVTR